MTREWKVGDRVRDTVRERDGVVVNVRSDAIDVKLGNSVFAWILPSPALVYLDHEQSEVEPSIFPQVKVEAGGETVLDTTAKRSRTIIPVVREYVIHEPCDDPNIDESLRVRSSGVDVIVTRECSDEEMSFDLEELELLLEVAKKLLQKE